MMNDEEVTKEAARVVEDCLTAYDKYLDAMIAMYETMLPKEDGSDDQDRNVLE